MGQSPTATLFFGIAPSDGDYDYSDNNEQNTDFSRPWRVAGCDSDSDYEDVLLAVMNAPPDDVEYAEEEKDPEQHARWCARYSERRVVLETCPVELRGTGYEDERAVLVVKGSVVSVSDWGCEPIEIPLVRDGWYRMIAEWADKLGIPEERRGAIGWHLVAQYG